MEIMVTGRVSQSLGIFAAGALLLSSCAAASSTTEEGSNPPAETTASSVTEITVGTGQTPWLGPYEEIVALYEETTGIKVNLEILPFGGLLESQSLDAQTGAGAFDVYQLNEQWVGLFYDNGWVQRLDEVDPNFSWDPGLIEYGGLGRWNAESRSTTLDGAPYSLPINGNIHILVYLKSVYEELGIDIPTTWAEAEAAGEAAVAAGLVDYGFVLRGENQAPFDFTAFLVAEGGSWFVDPEAGNFEPSINSPEAKRALEQFKRLADLGPDAPQTIAQAEMVALMQTGTVLQASMVVATASALEDVEASLVADDIGYAVLPGSSPVSGAWTAGIPAGLSDERTQAAYDFITWLTGPEAMQAWVDLGGVVTRSDVVTDQIEIQRMIESEDFITPGFRYPFTPEFLSVTEPAIGQYVAGLISVDEALEQMQEKIREIVVREGFLE
jgi:multiple sugar transport system substrate-binding protein